MGKKTNVEDISYKILKAYKNNDIRTDRSDKGVIFINGKEETIVNKKINDIKEKLIKKMEKFIEVNNFERVQEIVNILRTLNMDYE